MVMERMMFRWILWFPVLLVFYLSGEMLADLLLPRIARPVGRWLRERRSPWFLAALWSSAALAMVCGWKLGLRGGSPALAAALFIGSGTAAVAGTINWYHAANDHRAIRQ